MQQGVMTQVGHALYRMLAQQGRIAGRHAQVGHQRARYDARALLGTGTHADIESVGDIAQLARGRRHPDVDVGIPRVKIGEPRQQPAKREAHRHIHAHDTRYPLRERVVAQPHHRGAEALERVADVVQQRGPFVGQHDTARTTVEQRQAEPVLQQPDLLADGPVGDMQFRRGPREAAVPRDRIERAQRIERGQLPAVRRSIPALVHDVTFSLH